MKKLSIKKETLRSLNEAEQAEVGAGLGTTLCYTHVCKPSCNDCLFSSRQVAPYCRTN